MVIIDCFFQTWYLVFIKLRFLGDSSGMFVICQTILSHVLATKWKHEEFLVLLSLPRIEWTLMIFGDEATHGLLSTRPGDGHHSRNITAYLPWKYIYGVTNYPTKMKNKHTKFVLQHTFTRRFLCVYYHPSWKNGLCFFFPGLQIKKKTAKKSHHIIISSCFFRRIYPEERAGDLKDFRDRGESR